MQSSGFGLQFSHHSLHYSIKQLSEFTSEFTTPTSDYVPPVASILVIFKFCLWLARPTEGKLGHTNGVAQSAKPKHAKKKKKGMSKILSCYKPHIMKAGQRDFHEKMQRCNDEWITQFHCTWLLSLGHLGGHFSCQKCVLSHSLDKIFTWQHSAVNEPHRLPSKPWKNAVFENVISTHVCKMFCWSLKGGSLNNSLLMNCLNVHCYCFVQVGLWTSERLYL